MPHTDEMMDDYRLGLSRLELGELIFEFGALSRAWPKFGPHMTATIDEFHQRGIKVQRLDYERPAE